MNGIVELDGEFEVISLDIGRGNENPSKLTMRVFGRDEQHLYEILRSIHEHGVVPVHLENAHVEPAPADGVFPEGFYSTTNLETYIRIGGHWVHVEGTEMDLGIRVDEVTQTACGVPISQVRAGDRYVVGQAGLRVISQERPREKTAFEFMNSTKSPKRRPSSKWHRSFGRCATMGARPLPWQALR